MGFSTQIWAQLGGPALAGQEGWYLEGFFTVEEGTQLIMQVGTGCCSSFPLFGH